MARHHTPLCDPRSVAPSDRRSLTSGCRCRRMLHPVLVVKDLKAAQEFYSDVLNMTTLRYRSFPDGSANGFSGALPSPQPESQTSSCIPPSPPPSPPPPRLASLTEPPGASPHPSPLHKTRPFQRAKTRPFQRAKTRPFQRAKTRPFQRANTRPFQRANTRPFQRANTRPHHIIGAPRPPTLGTSGRFDKWRFNHPGSTRHVPLHPHAPPPPPHGHRKPCRGPESFSAPPSTRSSRRLSARAEARLTDAHAHGSTSPLGFLAPGVCSRVHEHASTQTYAYMPIRSHEYICVCVHICDYSEPKAPRSRRGEADAWPGHDGPVGPLRALTGLVPMVRGACQHRCSTCVCTHPALTDSPPVPCRCPGVRPANRCDLHLWSAHACMCAHRPQAAPSPETPCLAVSCEEARCSITSPGPPGTAPSPTGRRTHARMHPTHPPAHQPRNEPAAQVTYRRRPAWRSSSCKRRRRRPSTSAADSGTSRWPCRASRARCSARWRAAVTLWRAAAGKQGKFTSGYATPPPPPQTSDTLSHPCRSPRPTSYVPFSTHEQHARVSSSPEYSRQHTVAARPLPSVSVSVIP